MKKEKMERDIIKLIYDNGFDIIASEGMQSEKQLMHHRHFNCFDHSISVACISIWLIKKFRIQVNMRSMIRGALLHDYFLYDWHTVRTERMHGFGHAEIALKNAKTDFNINAIEADIISKHMFPLNIKPPRYKESIIVTIADKICASCEIASVICYKAVISAIENEATYNI